MEVTKIHEWSIAGQPAELWIVNGKLQIRHRGTIHNTDIPHIRGRWEIKKASIHPYGNDVACSECGFTMGSSFGYKFCPMCGCKMEVEE